MEMLDLKRIHYVRFGESYDYEGADLSRDEKAAEFILEKLNIIHLFIKDRIDIEVRGFLFDEFLTSFESTENRSINSPDLLDFIKAQLKTDLIKKSLKSGDSIRAIFIFDPKDFELEIWKDEFLELSAILEETITIYGYHRKYEDIVTQMYDIGDYDTGIIACDMEVIEDLSLSDYMKSESSNTFPKDSIFEMNNYNI